MQRYKLFDKFTKNNVFKIKKSENNIDNITLALYVTESSAMAF